MNWLVNNTFVDEEDYFYEGFSQLETLHYPETLPVKKIIPLSRHSLVNSFSSA
jgi:hypothetical protein